jgi:inner membrane protein
MNCILNSQASCDILFQYSALIWFSFGILLCFLELIIPGTFVSFFGIGAIVLACIQYFAVFSFTNQFIIWILISLAILFVGAKFLHDLFPSEEQFDSSKFKEVAGRIAKVVTPIRVGKKGGRIQFQGTEWDAISEDLEIGADEYVKILKRDNISFRVVKASDLEIQNFLDSKKKLEDE